MSSLPPKNSLIHIDEWPLDLSDFDVRDVSWCYNFFIEKESDLSVQDKERELVDFFDKNERWFGFELNSDCVKSLKNGNVVNMDWIERDNDRMLIWLLRAGLHDINTFFNEGRSIFDVYFKDQVNINFFSSNFVNFLSKNYVAIGDHRRYDFVIEFIDSVRFFTANAKFKNQLVGELKNIWLESKTPSEETDWIEKDNKKQLEWAWNYLCSHEKNALWLKPVSPKEYHDAILASLDIMTVLRWEVGYSKDAEKELFIQRFRKAWSQKKFRAEGKTKKPYHLPLTKKSKAALETLAQVRNQSENEVLESLINEAYVNTCLDATGREKY